MAGGAKAAKFAKSFLKTAAKDITFFTVTGEALPTDTFWCKSEEADYFRALLIKEEKEILFEGNAQDVITADKDTRLVKAPENAARCYHAKFGEGSILSEDEKSASILFDGQKKAKKLLLTAIKRV